MKFNLENAKITQQITVDIIEKNIKHPIGNTGLAFV